MESPRTPAQAVYPFVSSKSLPLAHGLAFVSILLSTQTPLAFLAILQRTWLDYILAFISMSFASLLFTAICKDSSDNLFTDWNPRVGPVLSSHTPAR